MASTVKDADGSPKSRAETGENPPRPNRPKRTPAAARLRPALPPRTPAIIVTIIIAAIVGLSLWYLVQPQPILIQGEADATRIDIAARVDGRVAKRPVERGDNVAAGQVALRDRQSRTGDQASPKPRRRSPSANADLAHIEAGTRAEVIAQKKAALESAQRRPHAGAADLRSHQGARRHRQRAAAASRRSHQLAPGRAAQLGSGEARLSGGGRRLYEGGARHRPRQCRQGAGLDRYDQGAGRRAGGQGADRRAGLPDRRGDRRICRRPACRCCRWSISATSGCASICARIS